VNGIALCLFGPLLDQTDGGQDRKPASQRGEPDVPKVVPQEAKHCHKAEANPPSQALQPVVHGHGISNGDRLNHGGRLNDGE
jgi:hypothetical protein